MGRLYIALLHYPVYNRRKEVVATAVTNLDIHDIARAAMTFGVGRFYIVTPVEEQRELVRRIADHWRKGFGSRYNPSRKEAFHTLAVVPSRQFRPKGRLFNDKGPVVPRGIPVEFVVILVKAELPGGPVGNGEDVLAEGQKNVGIAEAELQPFAGTAHLGLGRLPVEEGGDKVKGSPPHLSFAVGEDRKSVV